MTDHPLAPAAAAFFFDVVPIEPADFMAAGAIISTLDPEEYAYVWADAVEIATGEAISPILETGQVVRVATAQYKIRTALEQMCVSRRYDQFTMMDAMRRDIVKGIDYCL